MVVIGERLRDNCGNVIGSQGLYVDLSDVEDGTVDDAIADFTEHRAFIEQAKGVLMMTYGIPAERAFDILVWRSQESCFSPIRCGPQRRPVPQLPTHRHWSDAWLQLWRNTIGLPTTCILWVSWLCRNGLRRTY